MRDSMRGAAPLVFGVVLGVSVGHLYRAHAADEPLPYESLRLFADVLSEVERSYVEPVDTHQLFIGALRGMMAGLEPHSRYLDAAEYQDLTIDTSGRYDGVGVEVTSDPAGLLVIAPMAGTPAEAAGIRTDDVITAVDGAPLAGVPYDDAIDRMRGTIGSAVTLTIQRGNGKPYDVRLVRDVIKLANVTSRLLASRIGYVRIAGFTADTGDALRQQIDDLSRGSAGGLAGLVLDLRNNPGGVFRAAIAVADAFLDSGLIVSLRGRTGADQVYRATPGDVLNGEPLVVMVNGGSASSSEIVAGALKDNRRALIVGTRTFGKGVVQTVLPLRTGDAIVLTTARYYTPGGHSIQAEGIVPDVEQRPIELAKPGAAGDDSDLARKDYALYESLNVIRAMIAYRAGRPVAGTRVSGRQSQFCVGTTGRRTSNELESDVERGAGDADAVSGARHGCA